MKLATAQRQMRREDRLCFPIDRPSTPSATPIPRGGWRGENSPSMLDDDTNEHMQTETTINNHTNQNSSLYIYIYIYIYVLHTFIFVYVNANILCIYGYICI